MEQRDDGTRDGSRADLAGHVGGQRDGRLRSLIAQQDSVASRATAKLSRPTGDKGDLYRNFGDGFTRAVELAVTPVIFGAMGYGLDRWVGTRPLFMTVFFLVAIVGMLLRTWYGYAYRMQILEQASPWAARQADAPAEAAQR